MFDYVTCRSPLLPEGLPAEGWQTQDLDREGSGTLANFEITEAGRLIEHRVEYSSAPKDDPRFKDAPPPLFDHYIVTTPLGVFDLDHHGIFDFYHMIQDERTRTFVTLQAKFTDGNLVRLLELSREVTYL